MRINLNSPQGNVFTLTTIIAQLMYQAGLNSDKWVNEVFNLRYYDDIVEQCKIKAKELSKRLGEEIEIYSSEKYEMEV